MACIAVGSECRAQNRLGTPDNRHRHARLSHILELFVEDRWRNVYAGKREVLTGTMTWNLLQAGGGTTVELIYTVGGFRAGGFGDIPTVVDGVLRGQLARLKAFVETGRPDGRSR